MAEIKVYRFYEHYRDPVCDQVKDMIEERNLSNKPEIVAEIATVCKQTVVRMVDGTTRRPHYATVMAITGSLGFVPKGWQQTGKLDVQAALAAARKWKERQEMKKQHAKERLIAARKAARAAGGHAAGATSHRR
jgi:hypothetical protein